MRNNKILAGMIATFAALICVLALRPFFHGNPRVSISSTPSLVKQWEFQAGGTIKGGLALDGDSALYAASEDGFVYALSLSGQLRWKTYVGASMSSPSVAPDGAVYISNNNGRVLAINRSGAVRWSTDVYPGQTWGQNGSAMSHDYLYAPARGSLCALRLSDGSLDWSGEFLGGEQWASVTLLPDGTILSPGRGHLNALNSRGEVLWKSPPMPPEQIAANGGLPPPGHFFISSGVAVASDRTLLAAADSSHLVALGLDGSQKWYFKVPTARMNLATPVIASDSTIYFASSQGDLYALDPFGNQRWSLTLTQILATPVLAQDGTIFALSSNYLYAVSPDGHLIGRGDTGDTGEADSAPTIASDGTIFVATYSGKIVAFAGGHGGLMDSPWPKYQADIANTGAAHSQ